MESLFEKQSAQKFIERINKLTPQTKALWGEMNVQQMLWHCQKPIEIATGKLVPKINPVIRFLFAKNAKKGMTGEMPVKKNLPTFKEAKTNSSLDFETEKNKLISMLENFQQNGPEGLIKTPHPFFGPLSVDEWNAMQVKHLDHHLSQFGV